MTRSRAAHPSTGRRGAGHPVGQSSLFPPGDEGAQRATFTSSRKRRGQSFAIDRRRALHRFRRTASVHECSIVARMKIEAALNIAEKRLPQDGRITKKIAARASTSASARSRRARGYERIVMRLSTSRPSSSTSRPGFSAQATTRDGHLIHRPDGIILVTGPTGSGRRPRSTRAGTINQPNINILTAEDPVEYELRADPPGKRQREDRLHLSPSALAPSRQDPDVVMVGEIRDKETVEIAINASLTVTSCSSTIHTNDAAGAFTVWSTWASSPSGSVDRPAVGISQTPRAGHALPELQGLHSASTCRISGARSHAGAALPRGAKRKARSGLALLPAT